MEGFSLQAPKVVEVKGWDAVFPDVSGMVADLDDEASERRGGLGGIFGFGPG